MKRKLQTLVGMQTQASRPGGVREEPWCRGGREARRRGGAAERSCCAALGSAALHRAPLALRIPSHLAICCPAVWLHGAPIAFGHLLPCRLVARCYRTRFAGLSPVSSQPHLTSSHRVP